MHLLQCSDSAFPVGAFSFSNALETATFEGVVRDAPQLEAFVGAALRQAAGTDGVAALQAFRSASCKGRASSDTDSRMEALLDIDRRLFTLKLGGEARTMTTRMGRKMAELAARISGRSLCRQWLEAIDEGRAYGCYPVGQGILFAVTGLGEEALFAAHQYGVASMMLSAALRCMRVSHFQTQEMLFRLGGAWRTLYEEVRTLDIRHMHAFAPELDILAALHEKGTQRMFMN